MIWLSLLAATVVAGSSTDAVPGFIEGGVLAALCRPAPEAVAPDTRGALCLGYIVGVADQILLDAAAAAPSLRAICLPPGVVPEDLRADILAVFERHPETQTAAAASVVSQALAQRYPCRG